jgi:hypothetical protein
MMKIREIEDDFSTEETMNVIVNQMSYGQYSFSEEAVRSYNEKLLDDTGFDANGLHILADERPFASNPMIDDTGFDANGLHILADERRNDVLLIETIFELGDEANTPTSDLVLYTIPAVYQHCFRITVDEDGFEQIVFDPAKMVHMLRCQEVA